MEKISVVLFASFILLGLFGLNYIAVMTGNVASECVAVGVDEYEVPEGGSNNEGGILFTLDSVNEDSVDVSLDGVSANYLIGESVPRGDYVFTLKCVKSSAAVFIDEDYIEWSNESCVASGEYEEFSEGSNKVISGVSMVVSKIYADSVDVLVDGQVWSIGIGDIKSISGIIVALSCTNNNYIDSSKSKAFLLTDGIESSSCNTGDEEYEINLNEEISIGSRILILTEISSGNVDVSFGTSLLTIGVNTSEVVEGVGIDISCINYNSKYPVASSAVLSIDDSGDAGSDCIADITEYGLRKNYEMDMGTSKLLVISINDSSTYVSIDGINQTLSINDSFNASSVEVMLRCINYNIWDLSKSRAVFSVEYLDMDDYTGTVQNSSLQIANDTVVNPEHDSPADNETTTPTPRTINEATKEAPDLVENKSDDSGVYFSGSSESGGSAFVLILIIFLVLCFVGFLVWILMNKLRENKTQEVQLQPRVAIPISNLQ